MATRGHGDESESSDDCGSFVKSLISLFPDSEPETEPILALNGTYAYTDPKMAMNRSDLLKIANWLRTNSTGDMVILRGYPGI